MSLPGSLQLELGLAERSLGENPEFLSSQLITYIGNKRSLLGFIGTGLEMVRKRLNKKRLKIFDVFSGSGIVARYCKQYAERLIVNDLEAYSELINTCYLTNASEIPFDALKENYVRLSETLEEETFLPGFIRELYAPKDASSIQPGERVFYTPRNAAYIDTARQLIGELDPPLRPFFLAPLIAEASVHANTSGVFKGFYKDRMTGVGKYGGSNGDALLRILGDIHLPFPVFSNFEGEVEIHREDSNQVAEKVAEVDVAYIDPPYNQHPYGSNYFMLNTIVRYERPENISPVSGIPDNWNRSEYNRRSRALKVFSELIEKLKAKYLLISFNSEGFIPLPKMVEVLKAHGTVEVLKTQYNTFRGSRNLRQRDIHVTEYLYLVTKACN